MDKKIIRFSWDDINSFCKHIKACLEDISFIPDLIVTPTRGGLVPSVIISHRIGIRKIIPIPAEKSIDDQVYADWKNVSIKFDVLLDEIRNKKILLVDDILASGETMQAIITKLNKLSPRKIVTASLVVNINRAKEHNAILPNVYAKSVTDWVIFPWEAN